MKTIKKLIMWIKMIFAMRVINKFARIFEKYPIGIQVAFQSFRKVYKTHPEFRTYIIMMYKEIAEKDLQLSVNLKPIKKGNEKYFVIVCKDRNLKTVFSLKRHGSDGEIVNKKPSYSKIVNH